MDNRYECESRVKGEQEHGSSESSEDVYEQPPVGTHFRGALDTRLLVDPTEQRFNRLSHLADRLREQLVGIAFFLLSPLSIAFWFAMVTGLAQTVAGMRGMHAFQHAEESTFIANEA